MNSLSVENKNYLHSDVSDSIPSQEVSLLCLGLWVKASQVFFFYSLGIQAINLFIEQSDFLTEETVKELFLLLL